jgi:putative transposase
MLVHHEFEDWLGRLELPSAAHEILRRIRSTPPSRAVRGRRGNVSGRYPSRKMGVTIQFESHRNELAAIYDLEHDPDVIEYYDQPGQVKLVYPGPHGRSLGVLHTPDFFVVRHDSAGWEECKPEDELRRLAARSPHRYQLCESGGWWCPPGEAFAAAFGFYYRIRSSAEISWVYQRNIQFLEDYLGGAVAATRDSAKDHVFAAVASRPGIRLTELFEAAATEASRDEIYALIAAQTIFADLHVAPLVDPDRVALFAERPLATSLSQPIVIASCPVLEMSVGVVVSWDAKVWRVVNTSNSVVSLVGDGGTFTELPHHAFESLVRDRRISQVAESLPIPTHPEVANRLARADTKDRRCANRRFELVCSYQRGEALPTDAGVSDRTVRSWVAEFRKAQNAFSCGYVGLHPRTRDRGNRTARLPEATRSAMDEFIDRDYESLKQKRRYEVWTALTLECESRGLVPASYKTFCAAVARRPTYMRTLKRKGAEPRMRRSPSIGRWIFRHHGTEIDCSRSVTSIIPNSTSSSSVRRLVSTSGAPGRPSSSTPSAAACWRSISRSIRRAIGLA